MGPGLLLSRTRVRRAQAGQPAGPAVFQEGPEGVPCSRVVWSPGPGLAPPLVGGNPLAPPKARCFSAPPWGPRCRGLGGRRPAFRSPFCSALHTRVLGGAPRPGGPWAQPQGSLLLVSPSPGPQLVAPVGTRMEIRVSPCCPGQVLVPGSGPGSSWHLLPESPDLVSLSQGPGTRQELPGKGCPFLPPQFQGLSTPMAPASPANPP